MKDIQGRWKYETHLLDDLMLVEVGIHQYSGDGVWTNIKRKSPCDLVWFEVTIRLHKLFSL